MCESGMQCSIHISLPTDRDKVRADLGNGSNLHLAQWHSEWQACHLPLNTSFRGCIQSESVFV